jgi:hypothetical protein
MPRRAGAIPIGSELPPAALLRIYNPSAARTGNGFD